MEKPTPHTHEFDTYVIARAQQEQELQRLVVQDTLFTQGMGGILPEQENPLSFHTRARYCLWHRGLAARSGSDVSPYVGVWHRY